MSFIFCGYIIANNFFLGSPERTIGFVNTFRKRIGGDGAWILDFFGLAERKKRDRIQKSRR